MEKKIHIMDFDSFAARMRRDLKAEAMGAFRDEYCRKFNERLNAGVQPIPKWTDFKRTAQFEGEFNDFILRSPKYAFMANCGGQDGADFEKAYGEYVKAMHEEEKALEEEKRLVGKMSDFISKTFINGQRGQRFIQQVTDSIDRGLNRYFSSSSGICSCYQGPDYYETDWSRPSRRPNVWELFCENYYEYVKGLLMQSTINALSIEKTVKRYVANRKLMRENLDLYNENRLYKPVVEFVMKNREAIYRSILGKYTLSYAIQLLNTKNKNYRGQLDKYINYEETCKIIKNGILDKIPDNYIDFFPSARMMRRKFVLHIGGTNSGKTYTAMQALKNSRKGVYLGPLRLLAAEQFYNLNEDGYVCSLKTGEEKKELPNARYVASTIEMLDFCERYEVAVIDEAQLISDEFRGGAWTNAILGVLADEVHVCAAPEAEDVITRIIHACGDECTVEYHSRKTPLIVEEEKFEFTKEGIRKGDALIVFSKKNVHAVANDLKKIGHSASIIYGALPYDVRQNEAHKFASGVTDILVTTDAIGLGMNLPIRRVVFLETSKFDGKEVRWLSIQEIKQIAGRAGRMGIFDKGYVNCFANKNMVRRHLSANVEDIQNAYLRFPQNLTSISAPLSSILSMWEKMETSDGFEKVDISHEIHLCEIAEQHTDDKSLIYEFITIPFEDDNKELLNLWQRMLQAKIEGRHIALHTISPLSAMPVESMNIHELEAAYKVCDLIYYYNEKFEGSIESSYVMEEKEAISNAMIDLLNKQKLPKKKCKKCGKALPWYHKYSICERCHYTSWY